MSRRGRRRQLSAEERALWDHVVRSVKPLKLPAVPQDVAPLVPDTPPVVPEPPAAAPPAKAAKAVRSKTPPAPPPAPPLASLEPKTRRRLTRGAEVDARLDLHGLTQAAAHRRLRLFLIEAQALGHSLVLVITGKGDPDRLMSTGPAFGEGRGVLKRAVPLWLAEPDLRMIVVGFEAAGRRHGGEGALYVRIRRRKA
ncbi:Smr/MutS family protein [Xanthobacter oligotrophicus]|uniref:Smr/MutS family protein n=1 Tax=Xanthobacter oligotrophicus TaxID=2607286 RepID=UPI0011F170F6|nr:Smr/MutS family protein [Xanthobacter oligotrophicus]MCG5234934.1 Smr/MutS family protein [Xanthobacter oligotrophicus]